MSKNGNNLKRKRSTNDDAPTKRVRPNAQESVKKPDDHPLFNISCIANDVLYSIGHWLSGRELCRLCCVCKSFCVLFSNSKFWEHLCTDMVRTFRVDASKSPNGQEKNTYRRYWVATKAKISIKIAITEQKKPKEEKEGYYYSQKTTEKISMNLEEHKLRITMDLTNISNSDIRLIKMIRPFSNPEGDVQFLWAFQAKFLSEEKRFQLMISPTETQSNKTSPISTENVLNVPPQTPISGKSIFWKEGPAITLPVSYLLKNLKCDKESAEDVLNQRERTDGITLKVWILYKCEDETFTTGIFRSNSIFLKFIKKLPRKLGK